MAEVFMDSVSKFPHSSRISERRRALFPSSEDESDSDLGHMSPLRNDTNVSPPDSPLNRVNEREKLKGDIFFELNKNSINDYDILENIRDNSLDSILQVNKVKYNSSKKTLTNLNTAILFCNQLQKNETCSPFKEQTNETLTPDTPLKLSPTHKHKTPQESTSISSKAPKLVRKSLDNISNIMENGKRKFSSPSFSPISKYPKIENHLSKSSRVRTILFPESQTEVCVPTKSFYPKTEESKTDKVNIPSPNVHKRNINKSSKTFLCSRRVKNRFGQINAGVRHKIRKPKQMKPSKSQLLKAALNIMENSPLNEYLEEVANIQSPQTLSSKQLQNNVKKSKSTSALSLVTLSNNMPQNNVANEDKKRELSPPPDPNKKFFKSSRSKAVVVIDKSIKLNYDRGKVSLIEKNNSKKQPSTTVKFDLSDLIVPENEMLSSEKLNCILNVLNENKENLDNSMVSKVQDTNAGAKITLIADSSVIRSDNSIQLHCFNSVNNGNTADKSFTNVHSSPKQDDVMQQKSASLLASDLTQPSASSLDKVFLSPTSQMCDMASGLALNSPKKAIKNITSTFENLENQSTVNNNSYSCRPARSIMEQKNLFPIFYGKNNTASDIQKNKSARQNINKPYWRKLPEGQMLLDAGQKKFGPTECPECKIIYHMGDPTDEIIHLNYHNAGNVFRFNGWKNEHVVENLYDAKIIRVLPSDPKLWWRKVKDLLEIVNRELGFYEVTLNLDNTQVYLYIKNKTIQGCLVAEPKLKAHRMLDNVNGLDMCSEESFHIKCGVSRVWVSKNFRKLGIGSALMNCLKKNFSYGHILSNDEIALSSPTDAGKLFAVKYFKTKNFLVYTR